MIPIKFYLAGNFGDFCCGISKFQTDRQASLGPTARKQGKTFLKLDNLKHSLWNDAFPNSQSVHLRHMKRQLRASHSQSSTYTHTEGQEG